MKIEERRMKAQRAEVIINNLLEVFNYCVCRAKIIYTSYPCYEENINKEQEEQVFYKTIHISDRIPDKIIIRKFKKKDENDLIQKHNTYYIHYKTRDYEIKFYDDPKIMYGNQDPMSYDVIEEYNKEKNMFCTIRSLNSKGELVNVMDFTFDIESMRFLYLYGLYSLHLKVEENKKIYPQSLYYSYNSFVYSSLLPAVKDIENLMVRKTLIYKEYHYTKKLVIKLHNRVLGDIFKLDDISK